MKARIERLTARSFPAIVALVGAHLLGVPYARTAALFAILFAGACLGLE
ncbi:hypothetical protein [Halopiger djelfimassiliensis]|nr:hypothetical protein [Halopiger djelfimassiliensis]